MLKLVLDGDPVAQARVRIFKRGNRVMTYDPQSALKRELRLSVIDQLSKDGQMVKYPRVMFWFYMPIPKSLPRQDRADAEDAMLKHVKKPDVDNLVKLYLDVISGLVFEDDNCVSLGQCMKIYSPKPRTVIYVEETAKCLTLNEIWEGTGETQ